jgi:hypothetical protein
MGKLALTVLDGIGLILAAYRERERILDKGRT